MKIVTAKEMSELEGWAYSQGFTEFDFMEKAGKGIAETAFEFIQENNLSFNVYLLCGKGNNAGDAFVAGRYLLEKGCKVSAIQPTDLNSCSYLCQQNAKRFLSMGGKLSKQIDHLFPSSLILDGIFGTGFKGEVREPDSSLISKANASGLPILSIDIPSGLNGTTGKIEGSFIKATETLFLGLPKIGFFLEEGWNAAGKIKSVDFGLPQTLINETTSHFELLTENQAAALLPAIARNRHKYQAGYVIGLAGSPTMPGAGLLSTTAAFRGGSGMVRLLYPSGMEAELASSPYELIKIPYSFEKPDDVREWMQKAAATFAGPGLGKEDRVQNLLKNVLPNLDKPCVIDADALTLYAEGSFKLPPLSILTPHKGEMQKLLKSPAKLIVNLELIETCRKWAEERNTTLILKGAPTFIFHPNSPTFVNPTGDPGMATAGSGDVLTGLLASLLSQGLKCQNAALLGVYLHGLAGEFAAKKRKTSIGVMASDLIEHFAPAYAHLEKAKNKFLMK